MEARLGAALQGDGSAVRGEGVAEPAANEVPDGAAVETGGETSSSQWPDEAAETAFRVEARERGESELLAAPPAEATEETDTKGLPPLDELVKRISPEARELLDELFRAKFTTVKRVPAKALKNGGYCR